MGSHENDSIYTIILSSNQPLNIDTKKYEIRNVDTIINENIDPPVTLEEHRENKLSQNLLMCRNIIEHEFKSNVRGDGLQPYRMTREDDQVNLNGMNTMITNLLVIMETPPNEMPLFSWQNANQIECTDDWTYLQIINLLMEFGEWKRLVLKRQDAIKAQILNANTIQDLDLIEIDYSDLLVFDSGGGEGN